MSAQDVNAAPTGERCPACGTPGAEVFHRQQAIPTNSCLLLDTREEAVGFPRGDLAVAFCSTCGFIFNTVFSTGQSEYSERYEADQGYSPRFVAFATELSARWVAEFALTGKTALEIGAGKGEFLEMMVDAGLGHGIGVDPGLQPGRIRADVADRITAIPDFYTEAYADLAADAYLCRHTLEHIPQVADFMRTVRRVIGNRDVPVLFELPDVARVLDEVAFWDVYYEHCSYFSAGSLTRLFRSCGFTVTTVGREFDDQYLVIEARPSAAVPAATPEPGELLALEDDLEGLAKGVDTFRTGYRQLVDRWTEELAGRRAAGQRVVIWGSGSKGVSFLSTVGEAAGVELVVDINPHKHGMHMVGTGQRIVAPAELVALQPDLVVVMNPVYTAEITAQLASLGLFPDVQAL